jgi:hypothetical protein
VPFFFEVFNLGIGKTLKYGFHFIKRTLKNSSKNIIKGHTTLWGKMSKSQRRAFQHSYSRHANELDLPN